MVRADISGVSHFAGCLSQILTLLSFSVLVFFQLSFSFSALESLSVARVAAGAVSVETRFKGLPVVATFEKEFDPRVASFTAKFEARMIEREAADRVRGLNSTLTELEGHFQHHRDSKGTTRSACGLDLALARLSHSMLTFTLVFTFRQPSNPSLPLMNVVSHSRPVLVSVLRSVTRSTRLMQMLRSVWQRLRRTMLHAY